MGAFTISPEEFLVRSAAQDNGVDPDVAARIAHTESGYDQNAVSPKGARGVMQLMPSTAKDLGVNPNDMAENIDGGVRYYKQLLDKYNGDERKAAAAYNAGPTRVDSGKPLPPETQAYVDKVAPPKDFTLSPEDFLKSDAAPQSLPVPGQSTVPGMGPLGSAPPPMPGAPVPAGLRTAPPAATPVAAPSTPVAPSAVPGLERLGGVPPAAGQPPAVQMQPQQALFGNNPPAQHAPVISGQEGGFSVPRQVAQSVQAQDPGGEQFKSLMREAWKGYSGEIPRGDTPAESVALGLAKAAAGFTSPESMAYMIGGEAAGAMLKAAANAPKLAALLAENPAVRKALDIAAGGAIHAGFSGYSAFQGVQGGREAVDAYQKGDLNAAAQYGAQAAGNLLFAALGAVGARQAIKATAAAYPTAEAATGKAATPEVEELLKKSGATAPPTQAQQEAAGQVAQVLQERGQNLAAQSWQNIADWDKFNALQPIQIGTEGYVLERNTKPGQDPLYSLKDSSGKVVIRGSKEIVRDHIQQMTTAPTGQQVTGEAGPAETPSAGQPSLPGGGPTAGPAAPETKPSTDIVPDAEFQVGTRKYTVKAVENGKVTYSMEGATSKPVTLSVPLAVFQKTVAKANPAEKEPELTVSPEEFLAGAPGGQGQPPGGASSTATAHQEASSSPRGVPEPSESRSQGAGKAGEQPFPETRTLQAGPEPSLSAFPGTTTSLPSAPSAYTPPYTPSSHGAGETPQLDIQPQVSTTDVSRAVPQKQSTTGKKQFQEDIITGTINPPLTAKGQSDAKKRAEDTSNVDQINAGPMDRTDQTAQAASEASEKDVPVTRNEAFKPWNLGEFQGKRQSEVDDKINDYIVNKPDTPVPGGQSYNSYKDPLIGEVQKQAADWKPGQRILNVTHSIGVHTLMAWTANGAPEDKSIDTQAMLDRQKLNPVALFRIDPRTMKWSEAEDTSKDGIYIERHADSPLDNVKPGQPIPSVEGMEKVPAEGATTQKPTTNEETPATAEPHKFSSTQVNAPPEVSQKAAEWSKRIPAKSLAGDGLETDHHVTVKYGLHGTDPAEVEKALEGEDPIKVKFGAISVFKGATPDDPDVLKVDVTSPDLHRLNAKVAALPHTDTYPEYVPHLTLGYVKRGAGDKYIGKIVPGVSGKTITLDSVTFAAKDGTKTEIPLRGEVYAPQTHVVPADAKYAEVRSFWDRLRAGDTIQTPEGDLAVTNTHAFNMQPIMPIGPGGKWAGVGRGTREVTDITVKMPDGSERKFGHAGALHDFASGKTEEAAPQPPAAPRPQTVAAKPADLVLTGNTYPHRFAIKRLGTKWNKKGQTWSVSDTPANRTAVAAMKGVEIQGAEKTEKQEKPAGPKIQSLKSPELAAREDFPVGTKVELEISGKIRQGEVFREPEPGSPRVWVRTTNGTELGVPASRLTITEEASKHSEETTATNRPQPGDRVQVNTHTGMGGRPEDFGVLSNISTNGKTALVKLDNGEERSFPIADVSKSSRVIPGKWKMGDLVTYHGKPYEIGFVGGGIVKLQDRTTHERTHNFVPQNSEELKHDIGEETESTKPKAEEATGAPGLAKAVYDALSSGKSLGNVTELNKLAEKHFGSARTSGQWSPKDAFDAMEAGINRYLVEQGQALMEMPTEDGLRELRSLMSKITSQGTRTEEQDKFQQFSTPPTESYVVSKVADLRPEDVVLEPSAGTGGLAVWPKAIGAKVYVNEISERRREMLDIAGFGEATAHDGEIINAMLPPDVKPTVVLMNPPFSAGGAKSGPAKNTNQYGFNHVDSALQRLAKGGRLVAILGGGRADDANGGATLLGGPSGKWFTDLATRYNVRANIRVEGKEYQKYGTSFATRIIVIDKDGPTPSRVQADPDWSSVKRGNATTLEEAYNLLRDVAGSRPAIGQEISTAESNGEVQAGEGESRPPKAGVAGQPQPGVGSIQPSGPGTTGERGTGRQPVSRGPDQPGGGVRPGAAGERTGASEPATRPEESAETSPAGATQSVSGGISESRPLTRQEILDAAKKKFAESRAPQPKTEKVAKPAKVAKPKTSAPAKKAANPAAAAAAEAQQRMRDRMAKKAAESGEEPIRYALVQKQPPKEIDSEDLVDLAAMGAGHIVDGAQTFPEFSQRMLAEVGDMINYAAANAALSPDDVLRQVYDFASEIAKDYGVTAEPAPPNVPEEVAGAHLNGQGGDLMPLELERNLEPKSEVDDSVAYVQYQPAIKGPTHPGSIVETKTMSTVPSPPITYKPNLPASVLQKGTISAVQLEAIALAGQQNETFLPDGSRSMLLIGDGCVAAGTCIYNPISDSHTPIEVLMRAGKKHWVLSLTANGFEPVSAHAPFRKGSAKLYKVTMEDGRKVTVTNEHKFLTPDGWRTIARGLQVGHLLACAESVLSPDHADDGDVRQESVQNCSRKAEDCLDRYWPSRWSGDDAQPLPESDSAPVPFPSSIDALERTHFWLHKDVQELLPSRIRLGQSNGHLSKSSSFPSESRDLSSSATEGTASCVPVRRSTPQSAELSLCVPIPLRPEATVVLLDRSVDDEDCLSGPESARFRHDELDRQTLSALQRHNASRDLERKHHVDIRSKDLAQPQSEFSSKELLAHGYYSRWYRIESVEFIGVNEYYDMYVPGPENYVAEGIVHHNTGVGKGREAAGILWDNFRKGKRRMIWLSQNWDLMQDAMRDLEGVGATEMLRGNERNAKGQFTTSAKSFVRPMSDFKHGESIKHEGLLYLTYATARGKDKKGNRRIKQIEEWLRGEDDGDSAYLIADEIQALKNAVVGGRAKASQQGVAVRELLQNLPKLGVTALSATAATDVINLGWMDRLGIWGPGTAFPTGFNEFAAAIASGRTAAMEMIASELKAQGKYLSRTLSFKGVEFNEEKHELTDEQKAIYRTAADAWKQVFKAGNETIQKTTNGGSDQKARFNQSMGGAQQRFFNLLITALKTPTAIELANKALADGKSVTITMVNTGEAAQNREKNRVAAARMEGEDEEDDIPEYDFGPKQILIDLIRESYPTQQYADDVDDNGNPIKVPVTRMDDQGREVAVHNPEAVEARDALIAQIDKDLHMPDNPLDILINSLGGPKKVAELTGRKERYDSSTGKFVPRGDPNVARKNINISEMRNFQSGKKRVAILTGAANAGISLHSSLDVANQQPRYQITLQVGWEADKAMQMLGRTHRTNQAHPPEYVLLYSDLAGEKRFISTISRRLGSLGALTKGQKNATTGTDLMDKVNLETAEGRAATTAFYEQLLRNVPVPGTGLTGLQVLTDLRVLKGTPPTVPQADRPNVTKLLNRLMALDPDIQNSVYNYFYDIFQATIERAIEAGTLDTGVKSLPGDEFTVKEQKSIAKDPKTGAETFYYPVDAKVRTHRVSPADLEKRMKMHSDDNPVIVRGSKGNLGLAINAPPIVHASGSVEPAVYFATPDKGKWVKVPAYKVSSYQTQTVEDWAKKQLEEAEGDVKSAQRSLEYQQQDAERSLEFERGRMRRQGASEEDIAKYQLPEDKWEARNLKETEQRLADAQTALESAQEIAADPMKWAKEEWEKQYEDAPSHVTDEHHLIGRAVMRYWNAIRDASQFSDIYTTTDSKTGKRVVGVDIPADAIGQLLQRISGGASTVNARQLHVDVLRNNVSYTLEGGIQVRRGTIARQGVIQLIPPNQDVARNLQALGALYERGVTPVYYIPNNTIGPEKTHTENIVERILNQYPVQPEGPIALSRQPAADANVPRTPTTYRNGILWVGSHTMNAITETLGLGRGIAAGMMVPPSRALALQKVVTGPLHEAISEALRHGNSLVIVRHDPGQSLSQSIALARHELFHAAEEWMGQAQRGHAILEDALGSKAAEALKHIGYTDIPSVLFSEIGAHLAEGPLGWEKIGLTSAEAQQLWKDYLSLTPASVVAKLDRIAPQLKEELYAAQALRSAEVGMDTGRGRENDASEEGAGRGPVRRGVQEALSRQSESNPYERSARVEKAVAMANALDAVGATPEDAAKMTDEQWKLAADAGQVQPPHSQATKDEVIKQLKSIQRIRAQSGERGSAPMLTDLGQYVKDKFGKDAPKANYSGLGAFERIALPGKQLAEIEKASPRVFKAALRAAGSESYASTLMRSSVPAIKHALKGSDHSWEELELYYVESRLRGLRARWQNFADQAAAMTPEELQDAMKENADGSGSAFLDLLSKIEGRQGLAQDLGQTAAALARAEDWGTLAEFLSQTFRDAADRVATAMDDGTFDYIQDAVANDPPMKEADRLYGELLEKPMAESHSLNEGVFSDALGPANRYFPLMAAAREQASPAGRRLPYRKPKNQSNAFATGLSESYDISMDAFAKKLSGAIRGNNKAALIDALLKQKWAQPESQAWTNEENQLVMEGPDGNEYLATREESSPGRTLIQGRKTIRIPAHFIVMPKFVNRALKPILAREPMDANSVIALMRWANNLATKGPLELIFHTNGVMGALYANTPFLGDTLPAKLLSAPIAKWFDIRRRMYGDLIAGKLGLKNDPLDPTSAENVQKLLEMSQAGALPARSGKITYSKKVAEETGAKLERLSFAPMLYGPQGLDARARVLMYDIWKAAYPKGDVESLHHFVNQIGNYIPELQGEIEKWFKHVGMGPFATAGMTRVVNGIHTFTGTGPGPGGTWKSRLWWWMTASAAASLAIWAIVHKEVTGKWPLQDPRTKLFFFPVGGGNGPIDKFRHSKLGDARWGKGNTVGYINFSFLDNPLSLRGARALGLRGLAETLHAKGTGGQAAESAEEDIINSFAGPALGPFTRAAIVAGTGSTPYLTGFRDYRTGRAGLSFMPAIPAKTKPGWPTVGERALSAAKQLNSLGAEAAENLGGLTGLYTPDQELPKGAGAWWMRSILDLAAPGLFGNSGNPYAKRTALRQQQRALGIR